MKISVSIKDLSEEEKEENFCKKFKTNCTKCPLYHSFFKKCKKEMKDYYGTDCVMIKRND